MDLKRKKEDRRREIEGDGILRGPTDTLSDLPHIWRATDLPFVEVMSQKARAAQFPRVLDKCHELDPETRWIESAVLTL